MNFNSHSFIIPGRVLFEQGGLAKLSGELKAKGLNKVLLASDRGLEAVGMVKRLEGLLSSGGVEYVTYLDIEANPSTETVDKGVQLYKENALEAIVCLGGGSPMDTAKAIAVLVTGGGKIQDYEGGHKVKGPVAPIIAIPTTAGTGSEVTPFAVITDKSKTISLLSLAMQ